MWEEEVTFPSSFNFPPSYEGGKVILPPSVTFPLSYEGGKVTLFLAPAIGKKALRWPLAPTCDPLGLYYNINILIIKIAAKP